MNEQTTDPNDPNDPMDVTQDGVAALPQGQVEPESEPEPDNEQPDDTDDMNPGAPAGRVLVIEDETPVANFLAEALRAHGVEVTTASDGPTGLQSFLDNPPDLVLCDLLIPKRNGFQLIDDFRKAAPDVPVVAMSGIYRREKYAEELAHSPLFLVKPIDLTHVQEVISLLERSLATRAARDTGEMAHATPAPRPRSRREPWIPLSVLPLPRLLHLLWSDRRTGLLTLRAEERQVVFMLDEGRLRFVRTNDPELRLDRVLQQLGRVTPPNLAAAEQELQARTVPTRLGEVLVEQGVLTSAELDRAIQVQLRRIVASAFNETSGETLFHSETIPAGEDVVINSDLRSVIVGGCMSVRDHGDRLLGHLPDGRCTVEVAGDGIDAEVRLPAAVERLLEACDEPLRLSELVAMADLVGMRGRWLVFGLLCADVLCVSEVQEDWRGVVTRAGATRDAGCLPFQAILGLEAEKATGILRATWADGGAWLAFQDGRIVQGASSDARTRIGGLLRSAGLLTSEQLETALREQATRPGKPLGQVLVEMGILSANALRHAVPAQVVWVAREMLGRASWTEATFCEGETAEREPVTITESVTEVVQDTLRELDEKDLHDIVSRLAPARPELDLAALRDGRFALNEGESLIAQALGADTSHLLEALTSAERLDVETLRVVAMALLATAATAAEGEEAMFEVMD